jgi:TonB family protein
VIAARRNLAAAFLAAATVHGAALAWVLSRPAPPPPRPRPPTTVRLVARTPPPAAPAERPAPPGRARETPAPRAVARAEPRPRPQPPAAEPAPRPSPAPQPRRFAVSMDAVVPGEAGGVAVPTTEGRTAPRGDPTLPPSAPVGNAVAPPADVTEVERAPRALRQPSSAEIRALYPQPAREAQLEGDVRVDLLVSERGAVTEVRVRSGGANGFGDAAVRVARLLAFEPATRGGRPVAVWIPWTIKFRLEG